MQVKQVIAANATSSWPPHSLPSPEPISDSFTVTCAHSAWLEMPNSKGRHWPENQSKQFSVSCIQVKNLSSFLDRFECGRADIYYSIKKRGMSFSVAFLTVTGDLIYSDSRPFVWQDTVMNPRKSKASKIGFQYLSRFLIRNNPQ